jgi:hypothetical protein
VQGGIPPAEKNFFLWYNPAADRADSSVGFGAAVARQAFFGRFGTALTRVGERGGAMAVIPPIDKHNP